MAYLSEYALLCEHKYFISTIIFSQKWSLTFWSVLVKYIILFDISIKAKDWIHFFSLTVRLQTNGSHLFYSLQILGGNETLQQNTGKTQYFTMNDTLARMEINCYWYSLQITSFSQSNRHTRYGASLVGSYYWIVRSILTWCSILMPLCQTKLILLNDSIIILYTQLLVLQYPILIAAPFIGA